VTPGVWMVPVALVATVLLVWASVWFEGRVAPIGDRPLRTLKAVDIGHADTDTGQALVGIDRHRGSEPDRSAA
jgi:hypothetical protein